MLRLIVLCLFAAVLLPVQMEAKVRNSHSTPNRRAPRSSADRAARAQNRINKGRHMSTRTWKKYKPVKSKGKISQAYRLQKH